jgi:hypothetical protein
MEAEERADGQARGQADGQAGGGAERRVHPRYPVDAGATLLLVSHGRSIAGQILELSVSGCQLRTPFPFTAGIKARVEIVFRIHGIAFRFGGIVEWTRQRQLGLRFVDVPSRRLVELSDVLLETAADLAAKAAKQGASGYAAQPVSESRSRKKEQQGQALAGPEKNVEHFPNSARPESLLQAANGPQTNPTRQTLPEKQPEPASRLPETGHDAQQAAKHTGRDRRAQSRVAIDTSADILLINIGCHVAGRIQDLSVGGCRIHVNERFPVGIYTRVETEFRLQGLPFRLTGVIQALYDQQRQIVGIRFLDMSDRKREQVEQLIKEMEAEREQQSEQEAGEAAGT